MRLPNGQNIDLIAEIKPFSPFKGVNRHSKEYLLELALIHGDILSVHVEETWKGSLDWLRYVRSLTSKPILAKGICATDSQLEACLQAGANKVLVVGRIPEKTYLDFVYLEPTQDPTVFYAAPYVWNSRNPHTNLPSQVSYSHLRANCSYLVQASNISTVENLTSNANAALVGWALPEFLASANRI